MGCSLGERLQRFEKSDQLRFLLVGQIHSEALVVEIGDLLEVSGRAVMEKGRASRQTAQDRPLILLMSEQNPEISAFLGSEV